MMQLLARVFVTALLVCCTNGHLLSLLRPPTPQHDFPLCPGHPLPVVDTSDVLARLRPVLDEAAKNISAILREDKAPGGAVVGVVYRDTLIWSQGFGLINDSGVVHIWYKWTLFRYDVMGEKVGTKWIKYMKTRMFYT